MSESMDGQLKNTVSVEDVTPVEIAPGILRRPLPRTPHAAGWLIDFGPGTEWPEVDHHATEERYFVLSGEIIDGGDRHGPGSYVVFAPGSSHRPRSETGGRMLGITVFSSGS
ncbi:cupin domain-containing protein [Streptomyces triticirhizae]|uniref:Anti-sigma factor n=1 Tax=Streptomyces triticirhizae TaxID=2483353 RepID=A0A3M2LML5_9ACTN|nr:cupin domain-containing protein [Streptomyces triticirhizae]RMI38692.1 anti-sigma factor [Streptomyces triticirhizae]